MHKRILEQLAVMVRYFPCNDALRRKLAVELADVAQKENPNFDRVRWHKACGTNAGETHAETLQRVDATIARERANV